MADNGLSFKKNATYNTVGTLIYDFCLWLTTLVVVRFSSDYSNAGIWQLSISITNIFYTLSVFNLSTYYISDIDGRFKKSDYLGAQAITCILSLLICVIYAIVCGYSGIKLLAVVVYMICRTVEAISGFFFGIDQRNYRMDYVGISLALRGIFDLLAFSIALYITHDIVVAILSMAVATVLLLFVYDMPKARLFGSIKPTFSKNSIRNLLLESLPSVVSFAAIMAISTIPRQFLESSQGEVCIGHYSTIAAPLVVLQVVAINIFNPILQDLAIYYEKGDLNHLKDIAVKMAVLLFGLSVVGVIGAKLIGEFAYTLIYGEEIRDYCYLIYAIIGCTILYAACRVIFTMLIVMRKSKAMLIVSLVSLLVTIVFSSSFISRFYMNGVSFVVIFAYVLFIIIGGFYVVFDLKTTKRK